MSYVGIKGCTKYSLFVKPTLYYRKLVARWTDDVAAWLITILFYYFTLNMAMAKLLLLVIICPRDPQQQMHHDLSYQRTAETSKLSNLLEPMAFNLGEKAIGG